MRKRAQEAGFKVGPYHVSGGLANLILLQIQYYFSLPNLITDHFLRNIINSSKGGWIKIQLFLSFKMIEQIFMNHLGSRLSRGEKRTIIMKSCSCSSLLQVKLYTIKRNNPSVLVKDFSRLLYIEGIQMQQTMNILSEISIKKDMVNVSRGKHWFFIQFINQKEQEMHKISQYLLLKLKNNDRVRILSASQFLSFQNKYLELIKLKPIQSINQSSFPEFEIPQRQIITYPQIEEFRKPEKKKLIKPKGKNKRNRLPRFFIEPKKRIEEKGRYWYDKEKLKIDVEGCEPRVLVKTPEQILAYRRVKIQARRQRKLEKANRQKQVQNEMIQQQGGQDRMMVDENTVL